MTNQIAPKSLSFYVAMIIAAAIALFLGARACRLSPTSALKGQTNITMPFYGKVVDQDGQPLEGAKFDFRLEAYPKDWTFATRGRPYDVTTLRATSDAQGLFELKLTGCMLRVTKATRPGYRQLEELDGGGWNSVFTQAFGLISWGDQQYKSDPDHPAVFVFVKDGCNEVSALPCQGGFRPYGKQWIENRPAWPREPSLNDVNWKQGQPRINVSVPLVFKVVDADGKPLPNVCVALTVEQYRSLEEMRRAGHFDNTRRTSKERLVLKSGAGGIARADTKGFRLAEVYRAWVDGTAWNTGPFMVNQMGQDYYAREFMDNTGQVIYRCDDSNPIVIVMISPNQYVSHAMPSRGGYELSSGQWRRVEPSWPEAPQRNVTLDIESPRQ